MTPEQLKIEIAHIFESGANEARVFELCEKYAAHQTKLLRHAAAEIALSVGIVRSGDMAHHDIMNLTMPTRIRRELTFPSPPINTKEKI